MLEAQLSNVKKMARVLDSDPIIPGLLDDIRVQVTSATRATIDLNPQAQAESSKQPYVIIKYKSEQKMQLFVVW